MTYFPFLLKLARVILSPLEMYLCAYMCYGLLYNVGLLLQVNRKKLVFCILWVTDLPVPEASPGNSLATVGA